MLIMVDPNSGVPVYRQLMDQIRFHIASGLLGPGDELPSTRSLSAELGVNPMTISKAYSYLERDGIVERRPGRPVVIRDLDEPEADGNRDEQLRRSLQPAVTAARQLGVAKELVLEILEEMLADGTAEDKDNKEDERS